VKSSEKVAIYTDSKKAQSTVDAFFSALVSMDVDVSVITTRSRAPLEQIPPLAEEALRRADMVFDLASESWLYTKSTEKILDGGSRMLQVLTSPDGILARPPSPRVTRRTVAADQILSKGKTIRIKSREGSDVTFDYRGRRPFPQDGAVVKPGEWDSLGLGMCNVCPIEDSANGTIVLNGTYYLVPELKFIGSNPVKLKLKDGRVATVEGDSEAKVLEQWLRSWQDPNAYIVSHVGFGLDERAGPPPRPGTEIGAWESMYGASIFALGANSGLGKAGGNNSSKAHADSTVLASDFYVDDMQITSRGKFLIKGLR